MAMMRDLNLAKPVEIAICPDITGSMQDVLDDIKSNLSHVYQSIANDYKKFGIAIYYVRVKIVAFRDFYDMKASAMEISPFYYLPNEKNQHQNTMDSLPATGGGDRPESSLEALALGIMSDWNNTKNKDQLLVLFTDAPLHPLEMNSDNKYENYPLNIPLSLDGFRDVWESGTYIKNLEKNIIGCRRLSRMGDYL